MGSPLGGSCPGTLAGVVRWVVFGTLLGPEATGPWLGRVTRFGGVRGRVVGFVCFWFPGCTDRMVAFPLGRVCVGCVVRGCCLRTT
jgi:hypothetical protein